MKWTKPLLIKLSYDGALGACADGSGATGGPGSGCFAGPQNTKCDNGNQAVGGECSMGSQVATGCKKGTAG